VPSQKGGREASTWSTFPTNACTTRTTCNRDKAASALSFTEILDNADAPPRRTVERATAEGWPLSGWDTAVRVAVNQGARGRNSGPVGRKLFARRIEDTGTELVGVALPSRGMLTGSTEGP
jgi:hypothetical protein